VCGCDCVYCTVSREVETVSSTTIGPADLVLISTVAWRPGWAKASFAPQCPTPTSIDLCPARRSLRFAHPASPACNYRTAAQTIRPTNPALLLDPYQFVLVILATPWHSAFYSPVADGERLVALDQRAQPSSNRAVRFQQDIARGIPSLPTSRAIVLSRMLRCRQSMRLQCPQTIKSSRSQSRI
jgi:hypothetical protein